MSDLYFPNDFFTMPAGIGRTTPLSGKLHVISTMAIPATLPEPYPMDIATAASPQKKYGFISWVPNTTVLVGLLLVACLLMSGKTAAEPPSRPEALTLTEMRQVVASASERATRWSGPRTGPAGKPEIKVAVICEDLRNGGVLGVARGVGEAANVMGWQVTMLDAHGTPEGRNGEIAKALALNPDGAILIGSDARTLEPLLSQFAKNGIPLVGWHIGPQAGALSTGSVAINVSSDPLEVARVTAMSAILDARTPIGVVLFTDATFDIAMAKANAMARILRECETCTLLEVRKLPISQAANLMPKVTRELLARHGARWTHALAINDIYFDYAVPELVKSGQDIRMFSAGDGSPAAFLRIQAGTFQFGTVAEPLNLQGWQLVDELNRLLSGHKVSGYIVPVHLVTRENIAFDGGPQMLFDPENDYRKVYRRIWRR
jgi:ribose transport system substrate-binding protein